MRTGNHGTRLVLLARGFVVPHVNARGTPFGRLEVEVVAGEVVDFVCLFVQLDFAAHGLLEPKRKHKIGSRNDLEMLHPDIPNALDKFGKRGWRSRLARPHHVPPLENHGCTSVGFPDCERGGGGD